MLEFMTPTRFFPFLTGVALSINFVIFWSIPVVGMGQLYRNLLKKYLQPIYFSMEQNSHLRSFAANYIYNRPEHADFFPLSLLLTLNSSLTIPFVFYWQMKYGSLPWWLIFGYYCSWVGVGGSIMGAAYALAHKEVNEIVYLVYFNS
jgi:hypothetical protein